MDLLQLEHHQYTSIINNLKEHKERLTTAEIFTYICPLRYLALNSAIMFSSSKKLNFDKSSTSPLPILIVLLSH